jgi:hypothetical protein
MQIQQISFPASSLIEKNGISVDYSDSFSSRFRAENKLPLEAYVRYCLNNWPAWIVFLLKIRNILVLPFGLKTGNESDKDYIYPVISISKGSQAGSFKVLDLTNEEALLFMTDSHLDAWLSIIVKDLPDQQEICMTTAVKFHNLTGRIYFFLIKPFHKLVIRSLINHLINRFTSKNK